MVKFSQIQLKMLMEKKKFGLFVVADPDFESNRTITKVEVKLDQPLVLSYMTKCITVDYKKLLR